MNLKSEVVVFQVIGYLRIFELGINNLFPCGIDSDVSL